MTAGESIYWGAWIDYNGGGFTPNAGSYGGGGTVAGSSLATFESHMGKQVSMVHMNNGSWMSGGTYQTFNSVNLDRDTTLGRLVCTEWHNWDQAAPANDLALNLAHVALGNHDNYITTWANAAKSWGGPLLVRLPHEFNASWANAWPWSVGVTNAGASVTFGGNTWTNLPADYVNFWKHVVGIFRSVGATNVKFAWCPNMSQAADLPLSTYWPGNDANGVPYVDWIGWDGYPWLGQTLGQALDGTETGGKNNYTELCNLHPSLPLVVCETGWEGASGTTMAVSSLVANGATWTIQVAAQPSVGTWAAGQGIFLQGQAPSSFQGTYTIASVSGAGPYTIVVTNTATGTVTTLGTAQLIDRNSRAAAITTTLETNLPTMPRIKAVQFFFAAYSGGEWALDNTGVAPQYDTSAVDLIAFQKGIGGAHYLAGNQMGANLDTRPLVAFQDQAMTAALGQERLRAVHKSVPGLVALWLANDASTSLADDSGNGHTATLTGTINFGQANVVPAEPTWTSISYLGTANNYASAPTAASLSPATTGAFTLIYSFYWPGTPTANYIPWSKGLGGQYEWDVPFDTGPTVNVIWHELGGGNFAGGGVSLAGKPAGVYWFAAVLNSTTNIATSPGTCYLNGTTTSSAMWTGTTAMSAGTSGVYFGQLGDGSSLCPTGFRAGLHAVYNRALSVETLADLYAPWAAAPLISAVGSVLH